MFCQIPGVCSEKTIAHINFKGFDIHLTLCILIAEYVVKHFIAKTSMDVKSPTSAQLVVFHLEDVIHL